MALFAALSYAITQSGRSGGSISKEQAKLYAAQIIQGADTIRQGFLRMTLTGTAPLSIVCGNPTDSWAPGLGSDNEGTDFCTTGENCLFAPEGGGVSIPQLPKEAFTNGGSPSWTGWAAFSGAHSYQGFHFEGCSGTDVLSNDAFVNSGTDAGDVTIELYPLKKEVCDEINKGLGYTGPIETWLGGGGGITRVPQGCAYQSAGNGDEYEYYMVVYPL